MATHSPMPVFFPDEFHGQRSLSGYSPQGCKELDMTEVTEHTYMQGIFMYSEIYFLKSLTTLTRTV